VGPVLYSIFINDLPQAFKLCMSLLYADDLVLYAHGKSVKEVQSVIEEELAMLASWCRDNGMLVNVQKTKCMIFMNRRRNLEPLVLSYDTAPIEEVKSFIYLGVELDQCLVFKLHFDKVHRKIMGRVRLIKRYTRNYPRKQVHMFVNSLIFSIVDYCLPVWGYMCNTEIERLDKALLKALQIIPSHINLKSKLDIFEHNNQLTLSERRDLLALKFLFNHGVKDSSVSKLFEKDLCKNSHDRSSISARNFVVPMMRTVFGQRSCFYQGIKSWNSLPTKVKESVTIGSLETGVRNHLLTLRVSAFV